VGKDENPSLNRFGLGRMKTLTEKSENAAQSENLPALLAYTGLSLQPSELKSSLVAEMLQRRYRDQI
jgi:hypothetical protein